MILDIVIVRELKSSVAEKDRHERYYSACRVFMNSCLSTLVDFYEASREGQIRLHYQRQGGLDLLQFAVRKRYRFGLRSLRVKGQQK